MQKILIYGGGFNPPHLGHEKLLEAARAFLKPDRTLIVPSAISPHKDPAAVSLAVREEMCRTFLRVGEPIRVSGIERAGRHDKSYTVKTLRRLRRRFPDARFYLLIGSDMLRSFETWYRFRRILSLATLVAATRTGDDRDALESMRRRLEKQGGEVILLPFEPFPVSSTDIRHVLEAGNDASGMVSAHTMRVICKYGLYKKGGDVL